MTAWKPYAPTQRQPWDAARVAHLHRRAIFGLTASELQRDLDSEPQDAVSRVLSGEARDEGVPAEFSHMSRLIGNAAVEQPNPDRLKAWWVYRFLFSPDPLAERLTFMWHNHFATSNLKVDSLSLMKSQNDTLRAHGRGEFGTLLQSMLKDPALLLWLDAPVNRSGHPNENLGRELLELFTLGIGHYTEDDVRDSARALTGLTVKDGRFVLDPFRHDPGSKTVLGKTERFTPDQLADHLISVPATSTRLADTLVAEFLAPGLVSDAARDELATHLAASKLNIAGAVDTILRSELFFSPANMNRRICDPVTFLIAPIRSLELFAVPPGTLKLADWLRRMGLALFYPPNVAGWPGGRTWLTTRTVIARANYASAVVSGAVRRVAAAPDLATLAGKYAAERPETFRSLMQTLLLGGAREPIDTTKHEDIVLQLLTGTNAHLH